MKVAELKMELKKRGMVVSGSKVIFFIFGSNARVLTN